MTAVRGIRGAIDVERNERGEILARTRTLLETMIRENEVRTEDVAAAFFSLTPDLDAEFPAIAARELGWTDVPLMCVQELDVRGAMEKVVRILLLVNTDRPASAVRHQYLGNTQRLRPDLAAKPRRGEP
ncbi:MAG TPA: chorismate mutase [Planctomycetota bacterium]|nr:chorismate mutase [Planctomycetota bacterium]